MIGYKPSIYRQLWFGFKKLENKRLRYLLCILVLLIASETALGQDTSDAITTIKPEDTTATAEPQVVQYDIDSDVSPLLLDDATLEDFKNDPDFNYNPPEEADNWWTQFLDWISDVWTSFWRWVGRIWQSFWELILGDAQGSTLWSFVINVLPWIILAVLIAFVIWLFYKLNPGAKLLKSKTKPSVFFSEEEEIIRSRDIKKLIENALKQNNFRLAVRYYYLLILKQLTDAELITYEFDKTNSDYFAEIASENINTQFRKATNLYDYIWYGNFTVTQDDFRKAQQTFHQLEQTIPQTA